MCGWCPEKASQGRRSFRGALEDQEEFARLHGSVGGTAGGRSDANLCKCEAAGDVR